MKIRSTSSRVPKTAGIVVEQVTQVGDYMLRYLVLAGDPAWSDKRFMHMQGGWAWARPSGEPGTYFAVAP